MNKRRVLRGLAVLATAMTLLGCIQPNVEYVKADRATFDVVAPAYRSYIGADGRLTLEQKQRRDDLVESWRIRVEKAEAGIR